MLSIAKAPFAFVHYLIRVQESKPYSFPVVFAFCLFTAMARGAEEIIFFGIKLKASEVAVFVHFYLSLAIILTTGISLVGKLQWKKVFNTVLVGIFLGIFPPLIDLLLGHDYPVFYGFYFVHNFREIPWLGYKPEFNFPPGECITIWLSIFFSGYYVFYKTRSVLRAAASALFAYVGFMLFGSFLPMLTTFLVAGHVPDVQFARSLDENLLRAIVYYNALAQISLASLSYLLLRKELLWHLIKRSLHPLPFVLLALIGAAAMKVTLGHSILAAAIIFWGGWMNLLQNRLYDLNDDRSPNRENITQEDVHLINTAFLLATIAIFFTGNKMVIPVMMMYPLTFLYNHPLYRGKKKFPTNLKIEGVWGVGAFLTGVLSSAQNISGGVAITALLVFGGFSLVSALKDAKDIRTDRRAKTQTLYLRLMQLGLSFRRTHRLLLTLCLLCFLIPIIFFATQKAVNFALVLFLWWLAFAVILYRKFPDRIWFAIFLFFTSGYLLILLIGLLKNSLTLP